MQCRLPHTATMLGGLATLATCLGAFGFVKPTSPNDSIAFWIHFIAYVTFAMAIGTLVTRIATSELRPIQEK